MHFRLLQTFSSCAKSYTVLLLVLQAPKFKPAEYTVLTEEEWRRLKEEGYPEHLIKKEDAKRTREIDAALKRTVLPQNTATFLQDQCKWVCHQMELRIVLVGKVMVEPSSCGQLSNTLVLIGGSKGRTPELCTPSGSNFFHFHAVFRKNLAK